MRDPNSCTRIARRPHPNPHRPTRDIQVRLVQAASLEVGVKVAEHGAARRTGRRRSAGEGKGEGSTSPGCARCACECLLQQRPQDARPFKCWTPGLALLSFRLLPVGGVLATSGGEPPVHEPPPSRRHEQPPLVHTPGAPACCAHRVASLAATYLAKSCLTKMSGAQSFLAMKPGMAERTPKARAA